MIGDEDIVKALNRIAIALEKLVEVRSEIAWGRDHELRGPERPNIKPPPKPTLVSVNSLKPGTRFRCPSFMRPQVVWGFDFADEQQGRVWAETLDGKLRRYFDWDDQVEIVL